LAHPPREQDLAHHIVDLVRARMVELVALQVDFRAAQMLGQPLGIIEGTWPADIMLEEIVKLGLKRRVGLGFVVGLLEIQDERHQCLGHEAAAIDAEEAFLVWTGAIGIRLSDVHGGVSTVLSDEVELLRRSEKARQSPFAEAWSCRRTA